MSTLCMLTDERDTEQHGFVDHVQSCEFAGPLHELLHGLVKDVETARERTKRSRWGFRRNGKVHFAVFTKEGQTPLRTDKWPLRVSSIRLQGGPPTEVALQEAIDALKTLRGHRINGLTSGTFGGGAYEYFRFHVDDFESA